MIFTNKLLNVSIILFGTYNIYIYYKYINYKLNVLDTKYTTLTNRYDMLYNNLNIMLMDLYNNYYILYKQINNNETQDDKTIDDNSLSYMRID